MRKRSWGYREMLLGAAMMMSGLAAFAEPPAGAGVPAAPVGAKTNGYTLVNAKNDSAAVPAAEAGNRFGFGLFQQVARTAPDKNVFLSPTSIYLALAMTANGAGGATRDAMASALALPGNGTDLSAANTSGTALMHTLQSPHVQVTLSIADALWADQKVHFAPDFLQRVNAAYDAQATTLSFASPSAAATINAWVAKNTENKITEIVAPDDLKPNDEAVLTNAIYFKGQWSRHFDRVRTHDALFHRTTAAGGDKTVPMMQASLPLGWLVTDTFSAVRLPYGDGRFAMYAFLPAPTSSVGAIVKQITPDTWRLWQTQLARPTSEHVNVALPRFKIAFESSLKRPLSALGMSQAFTPKADFRPMGLTRSCIGDVRHKAVLEVDEEGSEAAAATAVIMMRAAMVRERRIVFDHPFFCAIADDVTGAVLFEGIVNDPE